MLVRALRGPQTRAGFAPQIPGPGYGISAQPLTGALRIDAASTLTLPVANRCVQVIADTIGALPLGAYRDGVELDDTPPVLERPETDHTRIESIAKLVSSLLLNGNAFAVVADRNYLGFPTSLVVLSPSAVSVTQNALGQITYRVAGRTVDPDDVLHVRGQTLPGSAVGLGVLELHRRAIGHSVAAEDYAGQLWATGALPDVVLKSENDVTPDEAAELKRLWIQNHGGRQRSPAVLSGGLSAEPLSWSNQDLEFLESRKWNAVQVCQAFGVPTIFAMVPSGESKTYQNIQQDTQSFVRFTLRPWLSRLEQAFTDLLPRGQRAQFNLDAMLRADTLERYKAHEIGLRAGFLTHDEVREIEDLPPAPAPVVPPALAAVPDPEEADTP